ncbi:hypothetical protein ACQ4M4_17855 [Leptolyngbya sp. AN02str]|uniref:hypothetical protein n=1 Tax=Leptolyngbya sp. AN02str TaxID=3423363 RepID=UPI003D31399B
MFCVITQKESGYAAAHSSYCSATPETAAVPKQIGRSPTEPQRVPPQPVNTSGI